MAPGCFLDTNVLLYAVSTSETKRRKRDLARELLQDDDWTLSIQVLQEFYVQATRVTRLDALTAAEARELIACWSRFLVQPITWEVLQLALDLQQRYPLSYWDAAILAAAECAGIRVRNPFRDHAPDQD